MISRRNIRVKVMQVLYSVETADPAITPYKADKELVAHLEQTCRLFVYLVHTLTEIARYAEKEAKNRASKHLPSQEDLSVNTKIAGNELLWKILEEPSFKESLKIFKPEAISSPELIRKIFHQLSETPEYQAYIKIQGRDRKEEKVILEFIFNQLMLPNELFTAHLEEHFVHWDDDAEMMQMMMLNFLQKPSSYKFTELISPEKMEFARKLLETAMEKKEYCLDLIRPKLKNWDPDRIALLDMVLMRLGVCEFLYFETIPAKVTINEYIDLAKEYSTPQSGQFVNGILDNVHKELIAGNQMQKVDYKKQS